MQAGRHHEYTDETHPLRQWWEGSLYENVYAKENGIWKIKVLNYRPVYHADFDKGWAYTKPNYVPFYTETYPANPTGPDELEKPMPPLWPETDVLPVPLSASRHRQGSEALAAAQHHTKGGAPK